MKLEELNEAANELKIRRYDRVSVNGKPADVTGVGADYIKVKYDDDNTPHGDSDVFTFDEFDKHKIKIIKRANLRGEIE